jgi:hypothetical protein
VTWPERAADRFRSYRGASPRIQKQLSYSPASGAHSLRLFRIVVPNWLPFAPRAKRLNSSSPRKRGPSQSHCFAQRPRRSQRVRTRNLRSLRTLRDQTTTGFPLSRDDEGEMPEPLLGPVPRRPAKCAPVPMARKALEILAFRGAQTGAQGVPYVPFIVTMAFSFTGPNLSALARRAATADNPSPGSR